MFFIECMSDMLYLLARRLADKVMLLLKPLLPLSPYKDMSLLLKLLVPEHFLICFSRVLGMLNGMSQKRHFIISFPILPCVFMCLVSLELWAHEYGQSSHLYGFSPVWLLL